MDENQPKECMIDVAVGPLRTPVKTLIDSGATHCMVGPNFFRLCPELRQQLYALKQEVRATAINGSKVVYPACIEFEVDINGQQHEVYALYSKAVSYNLVLGLDFLRDNDIQFSFKDMKIQSRRPCQVKAIDDFVLEPNSERVIWGSYEKQLPDGDAVVSSSATMPQLDLFVAGVLATTNNANRTVPVRVLNPGNIAKTVRKGTHIAELRLLDDSDLVRCCQSGSHTTVSRSRTVNNDAGNLNNIEASGSGTAMSATAGEENDYPSEEFRAMFDLSKSTFNEQQRDTLMHLLWEYKDIFAGLGNSLGKTDVMQFEIELKDDAVPFKARPYRSNPNVRSEIKRQVQDMLNKDIIEPSTSQFGSPVLLVSKPDGSYRFCIDYRKLNSMTKVDCHPIARADDCLESLGASGAKYFTSLDLESGYWQLPVHPNSRQYTAFVTHDGLYQCKRMSFGLVNAPSVFSRLMSRVLQGLAWDICLVYLDDVIIFSSTFEEHLARLRQVFDRFRDANLTLKPKKSFFGQKRIKFLGHYVSSEGIEPMPEKCKAVQEFPTPKKVKDVRSFLGLAGYYRRFIKDFSKIASPMIDLTKKDEEFIWTEECEKAFNELKQRLISPPILAYPNYSEPYILQTDASRDSVGMVLAQVQDSSERVIAYAGKRLSPNEKNYSTTEIEALAVIEGLKHFDPYLRGNHVTIVTDHSALVWLLAQKEPKGRIARWIAYLQQFDYSIEHKAGIKHANADGLSRRPYLEMSNPDTLVADDEILPPLDDHAQTVNAAKKNQASNSKNRRFASKRRNKPQRPVYKYPDIAWTLDRVQECQRADENINNIVLYIEQGVLPTDDAKAREILLSADGYVLEEGLLYHISGRQVPSTNTKKQTDELQVCLVVPKELRHDVLTSAHGDLSSGHYGTQRTYATLRLKYFWTGMYHDCKNWVLSCESCNMRKTPVRPTKAELHPLPAVMANERWAMDIVTLPLTPRGNRYVLTFTEYNSRFVEAFPMKDTCAETIARTFVNEICFRYGAPQQLLSDLGANLVSEVMRETCELLKVERIMTAPYRPQTDGLLEKYHSTMCKNLSMYVNDRHDDWDVLLKGVCYSYNTSVCTESTQYTPYYLMYGRQPSEPIDTIVIPNKTFRKEVGETIAQLQIARSVAKENVTERQKLMKERYDRNIYSRDFKPGDLVWIHFPEIMVGGSRKFFMNWSGPYIIIEKTSDTNFKVAQAHNSNILKNEIHVNRMKPFYHRAVLPPKPEDTSKQDCVEDVHDLHPSDSASLGTVNHVPKTAAKVQELPTMADIQPTRVAKEPELATIPEETSEILRLMKESTNKVPAEPVQSSQQSQTPLQTPEVKEETPQGSPTAPERRASLLPPVEKPLETVYEINKIIKSRYNKEGNLEYLIDWKGFPASARSYEPYENLNEAAKEYVDKTKIEITGKKPEKTD